MNVLKTGINILFVNFGRFFLNEKNIEFWKSILNPVKKEGSKNMETTKLKSSEVYDR